MTPTSGAGNYEIVLAGRLTARTLGAFPSLTAAIEDERTTLRGWLDQAGLHGVIIQIRDLGITLLSIRRVEPVDRP